jgi:hypothetical protein
MTTVKTLLISAGAALALSTGAFANVTVTNQTDAEKTVTFDKGAEEVKHKVGANESVSEPCPEGCGVRFAGHDTMAKDGDKLAITEDSTQPVIVTD